MRLLSRVASLAATLLAFHLSAPVARAGALEDAKALHDRGNRLLEDGGAQDDPKRIREGLDDLRRARDLYKEALLDPALSAADQTVVRGHVADVESKLDWWSTLFPAAGKASEAAKPLPEVKVPALAQGETLSSWCDKVRALYAAEKSPLARSALAQRMAARAGAQSTATLLALMRSEGDEAARSGVRDALVLLGGAELARAMGDAATASDARPRDDALEVVYGCLMKPERDEPERPWCLAIRRFHERKDKRLTLKILGRLDAMGWAGTAALGEVLYVDDFGYHDYAISLLAKKRDRRAVPPLVHKLDRYTFDFREQIPAHRALLEMGWYAVPELIQHLDDPAAGIWVSWTLRKITGETMGTTRVKWDDWWIRERNHHPELFADPETRPPGSAGPETEGKEKPATGK